MEPAVNPNIRSRLRGAVGALCDDDLHERLWVRGDRRDNSELTFDDAVLLVVDELATPHPDELVGHVLLNGAELKAFVDLTEALNHLLAIIGEHGTYADALKSGAPWRAVMRDARSLGRLLDD
jgi:hypothetical protein